MIQINFKLSKEEKHFLFYFVLTFAFLFALIKILPLDSLNFFVAEIQEKILSLAGYEVAREGTLLLVGSAAFEIVIDCSGLVMLIMFASLLYSTNTRLSWKKIVFYSAFLFVFNLARLAFTLAVGANLGNQTLDIVHPALWFVDSGLVFGVWAKEYGLFSRKLKV